MPFDNYFTSQSKTVEEWQRSDADRLGGCPFPEGSEDAKEWRRAKTETEAARRKH